MSRSAMSRAGLPPAAFTVLAALALGFLLLAYMPLGGNVWAHLNHGAWILAQRELPREDPFLPLAEGMPLTHGVWLSQVALAAADRLGGLEAVSLLLALAGIAGLSVLGGALHRQSGSLAAAGGGLVIALGLSWPAFLSFGPQRFGALALAILVWLLTSSGEDPMSRPPNRRLRLWIGLPILFALWANLDPSFLIGLAILACLAAGRLIAAIGEHRSLAGVLADSGVQRGFWLTEWALLAALLNPQGADALLQGLGLLGSGEPVWGWVPSQGAGPWGVALSLAILALLLRRSRRPVPVAYGLLLFLLGWAVWRGGPLAAGYGFAFALVVTPHLAELAARWWRRPSWLDVFGRLADRSLVYSAGAMLMLWIAFALAPATSGLFGRPARTRSQLVASAPPIGLVERLRASPPTGLFWAQPDWSDRLIYELPSQLEPMVSSHRGALSGRAQQDIGFISRVGDHWEDVLERYGVDAVVVDKTLQAPLAQALHLSLAWWPVWEDAEAALFTPVGSGSSPAPAGERTSEPAAEPPAP